MDVILHEVCKSFGKNRVLDRLNWRFPGGQISCVQGPSGCGKTTLLRLIAGLEAPDSGEIRGAEGKKISAVFQENRLLENLTAEKNILLTARPGFTRTDARKLLNELGLSDTAQRRTCELSGGMQRRVAVARALMNSPEVILADEPSGSLDSQNKQELHKLFFRLRDELRQTFVIVTHDESLACDTDRIIHMSDGRIVMPDAREVVI